MSFRDFLKFSIAGLMLITVLPARAWGPEGHRIVGHTTLPMLDKSALSAVHDILGTASIEASRTAMTEACVWPDVIRREPEWEESAPLHYVNIPRSARHYDRDRDCRDGMCVTAGIHRFANELSRMELSRDRRWQALAFLCHLVGDLHQPLHAGFRDDRGGNRVNVQFRGKSMNLHQYWDGELLRAFLGENDDWENPLDNPCWTKPGDVWKPAELMAWTDESHALAATHAYPQSPVINEEFARESWLITRQQLQKAASRLALILNAVLGDGEVLAADR